MSYFNKFPIVSYSGVPVVNIMSRVAISPASRNEPKNYIPHRIQDGVSRADLLADAYYEDPYYDWLVFFSNDVIDPYHGVFLEDDDLNAFITKKYGSLTIARNITLFYRNNWASVEDAEISVSTFSNLDISLKKYYSPVIEITNVVSKYERKKVDWMVSTNKMRQLTVENSSGLAVGDIVKQTVSGNVVATAEICTNDYDTNTLIVKNITGDFVTTAGNVIYGLYTSLAVSTVTAVDTFTDEDNIPTDEASFWESVSAYDYAVEQNEKRRSIFLLRKSQKNSLDTQLETVLKE